MASHVEEPTARGSHDATRKSRLIARRFVGNERGNIAIMFAFMLGVMMLFVGGAVDYTRYNMIRADLVESLDAAGLAMAQIDALNGPDIRDKKGNERSNYLKQQGRTFFHENFKHEGWVKDLSVDFDITPQTISPVATGQIKTLFLHIGERLHHQLNGGDGSAKNFEYLNIATETEITRRGSGKIELALVLDVTGSMASNDKIQGLRDAVDNLLEIMFDDRDTSEFLKIGVVPFNAMVNPGGASSWQSSWGDLDGEATYHGAHFFHVNSTGTVDTGSGAKAVNASGIAKVIDPARKVNHYDLYKSHSNVVWRGCVEARPYPLDELDTAPGRASNASDMTAALQTPSALAGATNEYLVRMRQAFERAPNLSLPAATVASIENSRFVPYFMPDEPDCNNSECGWSGSETVSYTLGTTSRSLTLHGYMFDDPDDDSNSESAYGNRHFINDNRYTIKGSNGERFPRYGEVVLGFRYAADTSYASLDNYWDGVKAMFEKWGATDTGLDEYIVRNSYVGWWNTSTKKYVGKYDQSPSISEDFASGAYWGSTRGPNSDCPAPILPLTNDRKKVEDHMKLIQPRGNTNSAHGAIWGLRVLSPQAPFTEGVAFDNQDWQKAIVLMTDGENVASSDNTHWESAITAYGYAIEERMGAGVNRGDRGGSGFDSDRMADQIDEKLLRICYRAKQEGVLVYTIIFGLNNASLEKVFKSCATQPTAPYYYKAPTSQELEQAFGEIAKDLVALHVSR